MHAATYFFDLEGGRNMYVHVIYEEKKCVCVCLCVCVCFLMHHTCVYDMGV